MGLAMDSRERSGKTHSRLRHLWRALTLPDEQLTKEEAASTFFRFFRSKHVDDLRLIAKAASIGFLIFFVVVIAIHLSTKNTFGTGDMLTYIGSAVPIYGAILAWAYLSASARLGIV